MPDNATIFSLSSDLDGPLSRWLCPMAEHALGLRALGRFYSSLDRDDVVSVADFLDRALAGFGVSLLVGPDDRACIPATGPAVVVANHPFGGIEGMALARLLLEVRSDVKVIVNFMLGRIPDLKDLFFLVDPFETAGSPRRSLAALRGAIRWVKQGGLLMVFPAGEVAHLDLRRRRVSDPSWLPTVARIVRRARCAVVPVWVEGRNSVLFQAAGLVHPALRTAMLPRELLRSRGRTIKARVGTPIPYQRLEKYADDAAMVDYLRGRTEILAQRSPLPETAAEPMQPRKTPPGSKPIIAPVDVDAMQEELTALPDEQLLVDGKDQEVWVAAAQQIPNVLREIGRLRETTFRAVGEGTGRELDLDRFDATYQHLFIWHRERREVVGAYRLARSDEILTNEGIGGLYTTTLFRYNPRLFRSMGPAIELGRSFIRPEYQRSFAGLMLLWKGIGRVVLGEQGCPILFGPVSISAEYQSASQQLIVTFLKANNYAHEWSRWVRPRNPFRSRRGVVGSLHLGDLEEVSAFIAEIESDRKGVPILLKQYLKLGGRLLGSNVDPDFSNVLDVLVMVDLRRTEPRVLSRYMGRDGAEGFLARWGESKALAQ